jgi:hypothetical protein
MAREQTGIGFALAESGASNSLVASPLASPQSLISPASRLKPRPSLAVQA